jgi:hypothetical protein
MYTAVVWVALTGLIAHGGLAPERPAWLNDYSLAAREGIAQQKPLAVFIGTGKTGWEILNKEGALGKQVKQTLASNYVCVYLDANKEEDSRLVKAFGVTTGVGLVLSDKSGKVQAFRHDGDLDPTELGSYLNRYADRDRVVATTETREDLQPRPARVAPQTIRYAPVGRSC